MSEQTETPVTFSSLPNLGEPLASGTFAGLTTSKSGMHHAVVLLPDHGTKLTWKKAMNWAEKLGAELPNRAVAALLFRNVKSKLQPNWHWTSEQDDASYASTCYFDYGLQTSIHKCYEGCAVAVRLIPITA